MKEEEKNEREMWNWKPQAWHCFWCAGPHRNPYENLSAQIKKWASLISPMLAFSKSLLSLWGDERGGGGAEKDRGRKRIPCYNALQTSSPSCTIIKALYKQRQREYISLIRINRANSLASFQSWRSSGSVMAVREKFWEKRAWIIQTKDTFDGRQTGSGLIDVWFSIKPYHKQTISSQQTSVFFLFCFFS